MTSTTDATADATATGAHTAASDHAAKRERMLDLLDRRGVDSIVLRSHGAVSWYLEGARTHVSLAGDPVIAVVVRRQGDEVRVFENEADRMLDEELGPALGAAVGEVAVARVAWHDELAPASLAASGEADAAAELRAARASLLPAELTRYRVLCREVAQALTDAATTADPVDTERDVAARIATDLVARGIDPLVTLVASRSRLAHRHPLPTAARLGDRAMLVVCGRRHGLIANATRWVRWSRNAGGSAADADADAPADAERRIHAVEAAFFAGTTIGATIGEAFNAGIAAYAAHGFAPDEWRRHHQGGATGYVGRDPRGAPSVTDVVQPDHAFAWNPSAPGAKVEDTVLVRASGVEVLTLDPRWPTAAAAGLDRPIELDRLDFG
jgi:Xaa-Pro aminopeptidase